MPGQARRPGLCKKYEVHELRGALETLSGRLVACPLASETVAGINDPSYVVQTPSNLSIDKLNQTDSMTEIDSAYRNQ